MGYMDIARNMVENSLMGEPVDRLRSVSEEISRVYRNEGKEGKRLVTGNLQALVYAAVRMPATFGAVSAALVYALERSTVRGDSLIDVGAGTGAATLAAAELLEPDRITCIEREDAMYDLGRRILAECGNGCGNQPLVDACWVKSDINSYDFSKKASVVISSYMLNEADETSRAVIIEKMWNASEELLLIVEPGTPDGYKVIKQAREILLEKGAHIAAPCTHENQCPAENDDWCHFSTRVQRSRIHKLIKNADVPYEDEKFSYIAFTAEKCDTAGCRIMRHPDIRKGNIGLRVCSDKGMQDIRITKKNGPLFKEARKSENGDILHM